MTPTPTPPARWQRRSEDRPDELIDAALELFSEKGFAATKTEDIARRAGVTVGTMYRYFPSKEALFEAAVQRAMASPAANAAARVASFRGTSAELLGMFLRGWWELASAKNYASTMKLVIAESANFPEVARMVVKDVVQPGQALCARLLQQGIERGDFRPVDVENASRVFAATISFAAIYLQTLQTHDSRAFDAEKYVETAITLFLDGLISRDGRER